jgi:hypothetical protein
LCPLEPRSLLALPAPGAADLLYASPPGQGVKAAIIGDLTDDGRPDAILMVDGAVLVVPYDGQGGFGAAIRSEMPASPSRFSRIAYADKYVGDFTGDGHNDLALLLHLTGKMGRQYDRTWMLRGDGAGHLTLDTVVKSWQPLYGNNIVRTLDIDSDGRKELINYSGHAWGFQNGTIVDKGTVPMEVSNGTLVDFDGDGDLDALGVRIESQGPAASAKLYLARNNGVAGFAAELLLDTGHSDITGFALGDLAGHGNQDLLLYGMAASNFIPTGLNVYVAPRVGGSFVLNESPIYTESAGSIRLRGGHSPTVPPWPSYYSYSVTLASIRIGDLSSDGRADIAFNMISRQTWNYRPTTGSDNDEFYETYPMQLVAGDPTGSDGVATYTPGPGTSPPMDLPTLWNEQTLARGDIDGDGLSDSIVQRGDATPVYGQRLAYAMLSSEHLPVAAITALYKNGVGTGSIVLAIGDRLRVLVRVTPNPGGAALAPARLYIDSNNNGVLDVQDRLLRIGVEQPPSAPNTTSKTYSFNVVRRDFWGGPGVRAMFYVPYDANNATGVPATWMVNLL